MPSDYETGYKKPPKHTQFKKGQSGNPEGRPPKAKKNKTDCLGEALNSTVKIRDGNQTRTMTKLEVIVESTINKAMQGDPKARSEVFRYLEKMEQFKIANDANAPTGQLLLPGSPVDPDEWAKAVEKHQCKARGEV